VVVYRLDDRLFFANARYFKGRVREAIRAAPPTVRWLVLDADAITHVDATGLRALVNVAQDLTRDEITLTILDLAIGRESLGFSVRHRQGQIHRSAERGEPL
jgi:MFS superfamily sulfate permease-like transporter